MIKDDYYRAFSQDGFELSNKEYPKDLCTTCTNNTIRCSICDGLFLIKDFFETHEKKCEQIFKEIEIMEKCIECEICLTMVTPETVKHHSQICKNASEVNLEKVECSYCGDNFLLDLIEQHEGTCITLNTHLDIMKQTAECDFCKVKVPLCDYEMHEATCSDLKMKQDELEKFAKNVEIEYPKWDSNGINTEKIDDNLSLVTIDNASEEFKFVQNLYRLSVPQVNVNKVIRIQNKFLWERYFREVARIKKEKGSAEEKWLFHGTRKTHPKTVYTLGFDISFANDSGAFGRGLYFARQAIYSYNNYAYVDSMGKRFIFLSKVLTGKFYVTNSQQKKIPNPFVPGVKGNFLRKPPLMDESKFIYYDSVANCSNTKEEHISQNFIVYENNKAYPYYLIEYQ